MPPRPSPPSPSGSFYPPNDAATYRDLLLFEERLKTNAASLHRRKRRYQLFLLQLLIIIVFLLAEVLLNTNFLGVPYKWVLHQLLPEIYTERTEVRVHPYFASGLLFVSVTTLVLFFASGMYSEKIGYANKYVPHANRALRNFNIPSPSRTSSTARRSSSVPIPPIPPASNPRGELIFSSRVDRSFREAYDRYRAQFERRRQERERTAYAQTWIGWIHLKMPWMRNAGVPPVNAGSGSGTATPGESAGRHAHRLAQVESCPRERTTQSLRRDFLIVPVICDAASGGEALGP
ncbi:hypothetical protein ONZ51_g2554 [Trametes cubensis]|uniref:Transmembrane protein 188 n=1 Tax=Trametes cubensis TaxID=1111947 RepID=A0AAD7TZF3_9APHY|nr:hypothetical protein ONZ51_g2554 [Trametes cubensis]